MSLRITAVAVTLLAGATAFAKPCPNVMLVLDQSGSMAQDVNGNDPPQGPTKWSLLQGVIIDVVKQYGDNVPFGLELFSSEAFRDQVKCEQSAMITVPLSHTSAGDIITAINNAKPYMDTNTGEAIKKAASDMSLMSTAKPDYIILVTDGFPNCNPNDQMFQTFGGDASSDYTNSQIIAARAQKPSIKTYVIGFDGDPMGVNKQWLDEMAGYGGTATHPNCGSLLMPPDPCYYRAGMNAADFKAVFDTIVHDIGGGEFQGLLCDDSCYTNGCPKGQICTTEETNPDPHCINDPCGGHSCDSNSFCRGGGCVSACNDGCAANQKCQDGKCVNDPCAGKNCTNVMPGTVCDPASGNCIDSPCPNCRPMLELCDVPSGKCVANQCNVITCPKGLSCSNNGNCSKLAGTGGGCNTVRTVDHLNLGALALLLAALGFIVARRARARA
jgi:hypothetical protein